MTHADIMHAAEALVADAERLHPNDRVKQAIHVAGNVPTWRDAYAKAISDVAFDRVFLHFTIDDEQVWTIWCMYDRTPTLTAMTNAVREKYTETYTEPMRHAA